MEPARLHIEKLTQELAGAMPRLDERSQRLAITLYRVLAEGRAVSPERLAERAGAGPGEVRRFLEAHPGVYYDDQERVVGFSGMALDGMHHVMHVDGQPIRAWCAWDTLFLPELIGKAIAVESHCPTTGETITLTVSADGFRDVSPPGAVLSFLRPHTSFDSDTIKSFCHLVHFFADEDAAREWTAAHDGTFVLSIEDGFALGVGVNRGIFAAGLDAHGQQVRGER